MKFKNIFLFSLLTLFVNVSFSQESCDSTCNAPIGLQEINKTNKKSTTSIVHITNDYSIRYEYQTLACPAGYQGKDGSAGVIYERRAIVTFNRGGTEIGEWIALSDNCEPIPQQPQQPQPQPPKNIIGKYACFSNNNAFCSSFSFTVLAPNKIQYIRSVSSINSIHTLNANGEYWANDVCGYHRWYTVMSWGIKWDGCNSTQIFDFLWLN